MFENKTIRRLEEMLEAATEGSFEESNYDEKFLPEAEKLLKSFVNRTNSVESFMNKQEKVKAKEAYTILEGVVRRFSMNKKII